jgi:hypothetical protein
MPAALLMVILALAPADPGQAGGEEGKAYGAGAAAHHPLPQQAGGEPSLLVPILEVPALNLIFWSAAKVAGAEYAQISLQTMKDHLLHGPWKWDEDIYFLNEFGHPYQGSLAFTAARSSGIGFWGSIPFAFASSAMWELLMETDAPSRNDIITTPIGGVMLGEALHRLSLLVLDDGPPSLLRSLVSFAIEPVGGFNRSAFGRKRGDFFSRPPYYARFSVGVNANVNNYQDVAGVHQESDLGPQMHLGVEVIYGMPGDEDWQYDRPFDHFVLYSELGVSREFYGAFFIRGLLVGQDYAVGRFHGLWGLFGGYDFASPSTLRVATVNLGIGTSVRYKISDDLCLLPTLIVSGVPFGAGGGIATPVVQRDYHYGFGLQQLIELQLIRRDVGRVVLNERAYAISGQFVAEGWEKVAYLSLAAELRLFAHNAIGVEGFIADRMASYRGPSPDVHERATQFRVYWTFLAGDGFDTLLGAPGARQ